MDCDILIIGAGIFGVSTAILQESQYWMSPPYPPPRAALTDTSKIVRADYTNPFYMEMAYEAMDAWANWPIFTKAGVFNRTGWLVFDYQDKDRSTRIRNCFRASSTEDVTVDFTWKDVNEKWPVELGQVKGEGLESSYSSPSPTWADASGSLKVMLDEAVRLGVRYEVGEVSRLVQGQNGIENLFTKDGRIFRAKKILLTTGAWTSQLMSPLEDELGFSDAERVESQLTAEGVPIVQFKLSKEEVEQYSRLPIIVYGSGGIFHHPFQTPLATALITQNRPIAPANEGEDFKIQHYRLLEYRDHGDRTYHYGSSRPGPIYRSDDLKEKHLGHIRMRLPQIIGDDRQVTWRACWESVRPDKDQLIARHPHPRLSNLYFAVGGSFHSWKFLPTIGIYVVNVLEEVGNGKERDQRWGWKTY
ncbi:hypothetical protein AJ79_09621 [Helicocarpus griseus UAMH5409]|uniref:FAD dependent oxidoreductase domain-containing protein n=1 Tax=Helicocarpus griseus UAMH5409 TaxID=1447875 RepID=A0A2B7WIF3_9EURO|nr:hypothetical protein AJ79_09621 [Helicocarpus griseus UAMH5409]